MPVLTRARRRVAGVIMLVFGEFLGVDDLVTDESRLDSERLGADELLLGVRFRVRALGLFSRPGMGASGLVNGPTLTASAA